MMTAIARTVVDTRIAVSAARKRGFTIGLIPTMGALHEGHLELVRFARREHGFVVVSVFVNPTQFGPNEDFERYPRQLEKDVEMAASAGASLIFAPSVKEMYPDGNATFIDVKGLGDHLCGRARPGHFRGVCTVVTKLFNIVGADDSYFGQKDAQQARIIEAMAADLNQPGRVVILPTVRESDGLAMSSRNRYLTHSQRLHAPKLYTALQAGRALSSKGETDAARIVAVVRQSVEGIPDTRIDYVELVDALTLQPVEKMGAKSLLALAVFLGKTRLIDNIFLPG